MSGEDFWNGNNKKSVSIACLNLVQFILWFQLFIYGIKYTIILNIR